MVCASDGRMASADGFRLYSYENSKLDFGLGKTEALVLGSTVQKAVRLFAKKDKVEVGFKRSSTNLPQEVYFKSGDTVLIGQLVQGTYPKYQQLIPQTFLCKASFSVPLMLERLALINPANMWNGLRMKFTRTVKQEDVCLLIGKSDYVEYELSLPVKIDGDEGKVAVQYNYIEDAVKYFSLCHIELTSPQSPMKFTGDIEGLTVVVMPFYVQW